MNAVAHKKFYACEISIRHNSIDTHKINERLWEKNERCTIMQIVLKTEQKKFDNFRLILTNKQDFLLREKKPAEKTNLC